MTTKTTIMAVLAAAALTVSATPTQNTYHAVTNDWRRGAYSNVLELAQSRLAANTNDIVAAYIMKDYDIMFSDFAAMSNSLQRLIRAGALVTLPAYTNRFPRLRQGYEDFLQFVIPAHDDNFRIQEQQRPIPPGTPMNSEHLLQLFWVNNQW